MARWVEDLVRDLRHGSRVLRRQPGLAAMTILMLSLGIGANTAIFALLNAALFRPLPFPDADRLVLIVDGQRGSRSATTLTVPEVLDVRARTTALDLVSFFDTRDAQMSGGVEPLRVVIGRVDPALFSLMGARPALGRLFNEADGREGSPPVVILSDGLWRRNFGAETSVVGRTVVVNGAPTTIAGVLPSEFSIDVLTSSPIEMFVPYPMTADYVSRAAEFASVRRVFSLGRLGPGMSIERASADLASIAAALEQAYPQIYRPVGGGGGDRPFVMDAEPLHESMTTSGRVVVWTLFGAVMLVLIIACVNTAQFLLASSLDRAPEVAVRRALGAGHGRLVRQFLSEALVLAVAAGVLALLQALWLTAVLRSILPPAARFIGPVQIDRVVLVFATVTAIATTLVSGLFPAFRFSSTPPQAQAGRSVARGGSRSHQLLIALEVAISLVLLVEAGVMLRTLAVITRSQAGFSTDNVAVMRVRGMSTGGPALGRLYARYLEQLATVPGVDAAAVSSGVLPGGFGTPFVALAGDTAGRQQNVSYQIVSPGYFGVLRVPLVAGRTFSSDDSADHPPVAIVNEALARSSWPDGQAIGQQIRAGVGPREATMTIIGIVGNIRPPLQPAEMPQLYVSYLQQSEPNMAVMVRGRESFPSIDAVKRAIWSVEARQAVFDIRPMDELAAQAAQGHRLVAQLVGSFAVLALVISVAGVFTVVTYAVSRRVREIAVRRAVGAESLDVVWLLSGQTLVWAAIGLSLGVAAAVAASRALGAVVSGLVPLDASVVLPVAAAYLVVVILAMSVPVRRALRIDPATALRVE